MKIGVISDSHGNVDAVEHLVQWFTHNKCKKIIHLGDDWDDISIQIQKDSKKSSPKEEKKQIEIIKVPGVFSDYYKDSKIPNRLVFEFEEWKVLLTHTQKSHKNDLPKDLKPEALIKSKEVEVILYGHTHIPLIDRKEGVIYINPGHLNTSDKRGHPMSFAIIEFEKGFLSVKIVDFKTKLAKYSKFFLQS